ncbi:hypothetical protein EC968_007949 [Mortierella alpina]|nr:hypothetical protein EC968_007949 [Mortierella alpina]
MTEKTPRKAKSIDTPLVGKVVQPSKPTSSDEGPPKTKAIGIAADEAVVKQKSGESSVQRAPNLPSSSSMSSSPNRGLPKASAIGINEKQANHELDRSSVPDSPCSPSSKSTPSKNIPLKAKAIPIVENVVEQELGGSSAQEPPRTPRTPRLPSPPPSKPQDVSVVQADQEPAPVMDSSSYPTAPSSPAADEGITKSFAGVDLEGEDQSTPTSEDPSLEQALPTPNDATTPPNSGPAIDGSTLPQDDDKEHDVTEEAARSAQSVVDIGPVPAGDESTVSALDVASYDPRNTESEEEAREDSVDEITGQRQEQGILSSSRGRRSITLRAPGSYFYATTSTCEGILEVPDRDTNGKQRQCYASTPGGDRCKKSANMNSDLCSSHHLFLRGHRFRLEVKRFDVKGSIEYQDLTYRNRQPQGYVVVSRSDFDEFTDDFHPLVKRNLYYLVRDFLLVLGEDPEKGTVLSESSSVIAKKYHKAKDDFLELTNLRAGCEKEGQVYMLVSSPRDVDLKRMWFAGNRVRDPLRSLPVKIGQSWDVQNRFKQHKSKCGVKNIPPKVFPEARIKYIELFEQILHELFVAHQHDILCQCGGTSNTKGTNHVEVFWFERLSGGEDLVQDFEDIVNALRSDVMKCQEFFESLVSRLSPIHRRRMP